MIVPNAKPTPATPRRVHLFSARLGTRWHVFAPYLWLSACRGDPQTEGDLSRSPRTKAVISKHIYGYDILALWWLLSASTMILKQIWLLTFRFDNSMFLDG